MPALFHALLLAVLLASGPGAAAQPLPALEIGGLSHQLLRAPVEFLETANGTALEEVRQADMASRFRPLTLDEVSQGISADSFWLRVRLNNSGPTPIDWVLHHEATFLDYLSAFITDNDGTSRILTLSDRLPFDSRELDYRKLGFRHLTPAHGYTDLWLRVEFAPDFADAVTLNFHLWEGGEFQRRLAGEGTLSGAFYGASLCLMLISFMLALMVKRQVYFYYGLFVLATCLLWLMLNGLGYQFLWPDAVYWHNNGYDVVYLLVGMLAMQYSRVFLSTADLMPRIDKALLALMGLSGGGILLRLAGVNEPVLYITAVVVALTPAFPVLGWLAWRRGVPQASWYALAWLLYSTVLLVSLLSAYTSLLPWGMRPLLFAQLGSVAENLLLLFATARRVFHLERERRHAMTLADTDDLTGLQNRRTLARHREALREVFGRKGNPIYLLLLDADHFKQINDRHGHEAGDQVLIELAALLKQSSRSSDACIRLGGEEFAVLVEAEDDESALQVAERIRRRFAGNPTYYGGLRISHTLSVGLVCVFDHETALSERVMLRRADEALYRAKAEGRNRSVLMDRREARATGPGARIEVR